MHLLRFSWITVAAIPSLRPGCVMHHHSFGPENRRVDLRVRVHIVPVEVVAVEILAEMPSGYSIGVEHRHELIVDIAHSVAGYERRR